MKVTIISNNQEVIWDCPTSYDDIKFRTLLELDKCGNDIVKVIALLTNIEYDVLLKAKIVNMEGVIQTLGFLNRPAQPFIPTSILGYPVPKDLAFEQVQMYVDLKQCLADNKEFKGIDLLKQYPLYCAIYACNHRYGKYDYKLAEKLAEVFFDAPCVEVLGIGNFTLLKLTGLSVNINPSSRQPLTPMKKFRLVLKTWRNISVHIHRWFLWRKKLGPPLKNC